MGGYPLPIFGHPHEMIFYFEYSTTPLPIGHTKQHKITVGKKFYSFGSGAKPSAGTIITANHILKDKEHSI